LYFNPLKIFVPLSFILFLASAIILIYSLLFLDKIMDITTIVLFISALQMLAIGMIADLIDKRLN
jgi:chromate transport protein ChrA